MLLHIVIISTLDSWDWYCYNPHIINLQLAFQSILDKNVAIRIGPGIVRWYSTVFLSRDWKKITSYIQQYEVTLLIQKDDC